MYQIFCYSYPQCQADRPILIWSSPLPCPHNPMIFACSNFCHFWTWVIKISLQKSFLIWYSSNPAARYLDVLIWTCYCSSDCFTSVLIMARVKNVHPFLMRWIQYLFFSQTKNGCICWTLWTFCIITDYSDVLSIHDILSVYVLSIHGLIGLVGLQLFLMRWDILLFLWSYV